MRSGTALDDSRDEYCIIKYVEKSGKKYKGKKYIAANHIKNIRTEKDTAQLGKCAGNRQYRVFVLVA